MTSLPFHAERPFDSMADGAAKAPLLAPATKFRPEPPLFRFGLRQLFWFVTALSALLAVLASFGGVPALVVALAALVVTAHVSSTALGTRLRAHADEVRDWETQQIQLRTAAEKRSPAKPRPTDLPPRSPLHESRASHRGLRPLVILGSGFGALAGGILLAMTIGEQTSPAGLVVGSLSTAVLAGWAAFLGGNFYGIARHVWHEAAVQQRRDEARRTDQA